MRNISYLCLLCVLIIFAVLIYLAYSTVIKNTDMENLPIIRSGFRYNRPIKSEIRTGLKIANQNKSLYENFEQKQSKQKRKKDDINRQKKIINTLTSSNKKSKAKTDDKVNSNKEKPEHNTKIKSIYSFIE